MGLTIALAPMLSACLSARPEFDLPLPHESPPIDRTLDVEPAEPVTPSSASSVRGDIRFLASDEGDVDLGRVVVYLIPRTTPPAGNASADPVIVRSGSTDFAPALAATARSQPIVFANEGPLAHGLFSAELGDVRFDLAAGGRSDPIRLPPVGPIRFYCALHADETFIVFAGAVEHVAVVVPGEPFSFEPIEPGRYTLSVWSELIGGPVRDIYVDGYTRKVEPVWIDPDLVRARMAERDHQ